VLLLLLLLLLVLLLCDRHKVCLLSEAGLAPAGPGGLRCNTKQQTLLLYVAVCLFAC
jgi:hypothetical protein